MQLWLEKKWPLLIVLIKLGGQEHLQV